MRIVHGVRHQEYLHAAQVCFGQRRFDRAVAEIDRLHLTFGHRGAPTSSPLAESAALQKGDYRSGWVSRLLASGRREEARSGAARAEEADARLGPQAPPHALHSLGKPYAALGERAGARQSFRRYSDAGPTGAPAATARRLLHQLGG